ncbi:MAG: hypothetical protein KGI38_05445 [Thaumarchaeota archaeon]|nr:hypothetical protein [Nitrososphaerota archaeon]
MNQSKLVIAALTVAVIIESATIANPFIQSLGTGPIRYEAGSPETYSFQFQTFNRPIINNTEQELKSSINGSWVITIQNTLDAGPAKNLSEAEMAFAPSYPLESKSIPTIIVQERSDGLLRVEYFAQSWPNTYGLVLYNSTSPGWSGGVNVTLRFLNFGQPSVIDPSIAPRSNGNLTVYVGGTTVVSDYPIAWASLADVYLYGIIGSTYQNGSLTLTFQSLTKV